MRLNSLSASSCGVIFDMSGARTPAPAANGAASAFGSAAPLASDDAAGPPPSSAGLGSELAEPSTSLPRRALKPRPASIANSARNAIPATAQGSVLPIVAPRDGGAALEPRRTHGRTSSPA